MALTLSTELLAAQESSARSIYTRLRLRKSVGDIPFIKNTGVSTDGNLQSSPAPIILSDNKILVFYAGLAPGGNYRQLRMFISDADQTTFYPYVSLYDAAGPIVAIDAIRISDTVYGVVIMVRVQTDPPRHQLRCLRITSAGVVSHNVQLESWAWLTGVSLEYTGTQYVLIQTSNSSGTYLIRGVYSSDFQTWGSPSNLTIGGRTTTRIVQDPKIIKLSSGSYVLMLSYENLQSGINPIMNLYYTTSNDLSTWADLLAVTTNTQPSTDFTQPDLVLQSSGDLFLSALKLLTYLELTTANPSGWPGGDVLISDVWVDEPRGKIYFYSTGSWGSTKIIAKLDINTWTYDNIFYTGSSPAIPAYFQAASYSSSTYNGENVVVVAVSNGVFLFNFQTFTITSFYFSDESSTYGPEAAKNVNWTPLYPEKNWRIVNAWIDNDTNRLYVLIPKNYYHDDHMQMGFIDLTQTTPPYNFTDVLEFTNGLDGANSHWHDVVRSYTDQNLLLCTGAASGFAAWGATYIFDTKNNAVYKHYKRDNTPEFPYGGLFDAVLVDGATRLFGIVFYTTEYAGDAHKYWICEIDLNTDVITYHYPSFETTKRFNGDNSYNRSRYRIYHNEPASELVITGLIYPVIFNYATLSFEYLEYTEDTTGPFRTDYVWSTLTYDPITDMFFGQKHAGFSWYTGFYGVPRSGKIKQLQYSRGVDSGSVWTFDPFEKLVVGINNQEGQLTIDGDGVIWFFWNESSVVSNNISWGKTGDELDVTDYFIGKLRISWEFTGEASELEFSLSHGHLFDFTNKNSIIGYYLRKGNLVIVDIGDLYNGVVYYQEQGTFIILEGNVSYKKKNYPVIDIMAQDMRYLMRLNEVPVAQVVDQYPNVAIWNLVDTYTKLSYSDVLLPSFDGEFRFTTQWMDTQLLDCLNDIANRFSYIIHVTVDNKLTVVKLDFNKVPDHIYSADTKLIDYSTDESFSDLTNEIVVTGQSLDDVEVVYSEERIKTLNGTVGWWGFKKDFDVYFSEDKSRRARYPRLEVIETTTSIMFMLAGKISERISYEDPDDKYCIVEIKAPTLIHVLITGLAIYALGKFVFDHVVTKGFILNYGYTISWGRLIEAIGVTMCLMVLSSMGSYQYVIWARPVGYVKRDYAEVAVDSELKILLGETVRKKIEGFLCFSAAQCKYVAEMEMRLLQAQRNRISLEKIAHLQDEVGDVIQVPHPYTGAPVKFLISKLDRTLEKGKGMIDKIEGWVI